LNKGIKLMDKYIAILEAITEYERITPSELRKRLSEVGFNATIEELVKHGVLIPTNSFFHDTERFYVVNASRVIDFDKKLPLSNLRHFGFGYSYLISTRIEKIVYEWAKEQGIANDIRKIWNYQAAPEYLGDLTQLSGKSKNEIKKYLTSRMAYLHLQNKGIKIPAYKPSTSQIYVLISTLKDHLGYKPRQGKIIQFLKKSIVKRLFEVPAASTYIKDLK